MIVLVTGFGAFPGAHSNPSLAILDRLEHHRGRLDRLGIELVTASLPVVFDRIGPTLRVLAAAHAPDAILHLGLAARRRTLSVETRAINRAGPLHPDAARRRTSQMIVPGGPSALRATYPAARIVAAAGASGIGTRTSIDAGDYVCNSTLYLTLANRLARQAGFIHVPKVRNPAQKLCRTRHRRPSIENLTQAVFAAILALARASSPGRAPAS